MNDKNHENETHLNAFWDPIQLAEISSEETKKLRFWGAVAFAVVVAILLLVIAFLIIPGQEKFDLRRGTSIMINGKVKASNKKIIHTDGVREELEVENIQVDNTENLAAKSPLLKKGSVVEYKVQSGDSIDKIAVRFYGNSGPAEIQKIKTASGLRSNTLNVGQRLVIPF